MSLKPQIAWYISIGDSTERQFLYHAERPESKFADGEKFPTFNKILFEMPTRLMGSTEKWLKSDAPTKIELYLYDQKTNEPLTSWVLKKVKKLMSYMGKSRSIDQRVIKVLISYEGYDA